MIAIATTARGNMTFTEWLDQELKRRKWRQTDLAQEMGMSDSTLSHIFAGNRKPGPDLCNGIAKAFGIPSETVFRMAGLLPSLPGPEDDELAREVTEAFKLLPIEKRREVLNYVIWQVQQSRLEDTQELDNNGVGQTF